MGTVIHDEGQPIEDAYGPEALTRLRDVKRTVDPAGVFRSNHPVHTKTGRP